MSNSRLRDEPQPEEPPVGGASVLSMEDIETQRAAIDRELEKEQEKNTK